MKNLLDKTISSIDVAEMVEKEHKDVLRDIRNIIRHLGESKVAQSYFIPSSYINSQNKELPCFSLTKKGCELYGTRMTGEKGTLFAVEYIERFNEMEETEKSLVLPTDPMDILALTFEAQKQANKKLEAVKIDVDLLKNEIDLSRNQKAQLSKAVRFNCMKAVGGKKARAYTLYYRVAISEHWKEIKDYFEVAAYEEIPKLQFNDAMELASMWHPSAELALKIKKANTQTELFDEVV